MKTYIQILQKHFEKKRKKNPRFSLRAFSIQAGLRPSRMSDMFNGRYGLSIEVAKEIAKKLAFAVNEAEAFILSVKKHHSRDTISRELAEKELKEKQKQAPDLSFTQEQFKSIKEWYNFSILQLLKQSPGLSVKNLSDKLRLPQEKIETALSALSILNLINPARQTTSNKKTLLSVNNSLTSKEVQSLHKDILDKAKVALSEQSIEQREFSSCQLFIPTENIPEVKKRMISFRRQLIRDFSRMDDNTPLYSFSYQLFKLTNDGDINDDLS